MSEITEFESVWDVLEDDPVRQENLKLRSELMITISETIKERGLKQQDAAELLHISQPRVSALLHSVHIASMYNKANDTPRELVHDHEYPVGIE